MTDASATTHPRKKFLPARDSAPSLCLVHCPDRTRVGDRFPLDGSAYEFGRSHVVSNPIDDSSLSRRHFSVYRGRDGYMVEDFDSTNGTFVGGIRCTKPVLLNAEVVAAGDTLFVVDPSPSIYALPSSVDADPSLVKGIVGLSKASEALRASIATVAPARGSVLLLGPTGSGKEVTARAIHEVSGRAGEFVTLNCAAIPSGLAESALFGHEKGAFTGADQRHEGAFTRSSGGTLFLDEVGDLPPDVQAKLLRVLEDGIVQPLGASRSQQLDLRIVAATHKNLEGEGFRRDLFARLGAWTLRLPSLAERKADILELWHHFVHAESHSGQATTTELFEALLLHDWSLNVREVRSLARQLVVLSGVQPLEPGLLPEEVLEPLRARVAESEDALEGQPQGAPPAAVLVDALREAKGNVKLAAENRGWHRNQLYRWLKRRGIEPASYR